MRLGAWSYAPTEEFALLGLHKRPIGQPAARLSAKICLDWDSNGAQLTSAYADGNWPKKRLPEGR